MRATIDKYGEARRSAERRAFSLFELLTVTVIIGLVAGAAAMRFGTAAYQTTNAEGLVRRVALDFAQARRRAIATGDDHSVQFNRTSGVVDGYAVIRDASGGPDQVDTTVAVPEGVTVTTASDVWAFDFLGALTASGESSAIRIDGPNFYWDLTIYHATGAVRVAKTAQP